MREPLISLASNITNRMLTQNGTSSARSANTIANSLDKILYQR